MSGTNGLFNYFFDTTDMTVQGSSSNQTMNGGWYASAPNINRTTASVAQCKRNNTGSGGSADAGQDATLNNSNSATDGPYDDLSGAHDVRNAWGDNTAKSSFIAAYGNDSGNKPYSSHRFYEFPRTSILLNNDFSVCCWFKPDASGHGKRNTIFSAGGLAENNEDTFQIALSNNNSGSNNAVNGGDYSLILNINAADQNQYFDISNGYSIEINEWMFVTITYKYDANINNRVIKTYLFKPSYSGAAVTNYTNLQYYNEYTSTTWVPANHPANPGNPNAFTSGNTNTIKSDYLFKISRYRFGTNRQAQKFFRGKIGGSRGYDSVLNINEIYNIYKYNSVSGDITNAGIYGDPHVRTLYGINYKFDYIGAFRMLDNNATDNENRLIINGLSKYGEGRWIQKQYIHKIYIHYGDKHVLIDTGFRGSKATVLENNGLEIIEKSLNFNNDAQIHCFDCQNRYNYKDKEQIKQHIDKTNHKILPAIRNHLSVTLKNDEEHFHINISNINEYNLQPCRIFINPIKMSNLYNYTGVYINRGYSMNSYLHNIKDISLKNWNSNGNSETNLPEYEIAPYLISHKYN